MKKIIIAVSLALATFSSVQAKSSEEMKDELFTFCAIVAGSAEAAAIERNKGTPEKQAHEMLNTAIRQMKQPYTWTQAKYDAIHGAVSKTYSDRFVHTLTVNQTKRFFDAACIAEMFK